MKNWLNAFTERSKNSVDFAQYINYFKDRFNPFFLVVFYLPHKYACYMAAMVFGLAIATDWLDGFMARNWLKSPVWCFPRSSGG